MAAVVLPGSPLYLPRWVSGAFVFADLFVAGPGYQLIPSPPAKIAKQKKKPKGCMCFELLLRCDNFRKRLRK